MNVGSALGEKSFRISKAFAFHPETPERGTQKERDRKITVKLFPLYVNLMKSIKVYLFIRVY